MNADRLYNDPDLARFYDIENGWGEHLDYCKALAADRSSLLDLGCGTGLFAAAMAEAGQGLVVGVDPAAAMLDIARKRPGGERVRWVRADARTVRLGQQFDLVVLTGHAFQVFLTAQDQSAVLRTIACHLAPGGRFVFDTRNPAVERWKEWNPRASRRVIEHPVLGQILAWNDVSQEAATGIVTYETHYRIMADGRVRREG